MGPWVGDFLLSLLHPAEVFLNHLETEAFLFQVAQSLSQGLNIACLGRKEHCPFMPILLIMKKCRWVLRHHVLSALIAPWSSEPLWVEGTAKLSHYLQYEGLAWYKLFEKRTPAEPRSIQQEVSLNHHKITMKSP